MTLSKEGKIKKSLRVLGLASIIMGALGGASTASAAERHDGREQTGTAKIWLAESESACRPCRSAILNPPDDGDGLTIAVFCDAPTVPSCGTIAISSRTP